jgi:GNAT superfamily N-acetyltransferase
MSSRYGLEIRAANAGDAPGLAEAFGTAGIVMEAAGLAARLDAVKAAGAALIAQEWGPPSGIVALHWYPTLQAELMTARITTLFVAPESRRRGIGRLLVKTASQAARLAGCGVLEWVGSEGRADMQAFMLATGFAQSGDRFLRQLRKKA